MRTLRRILGKSASRISLVLEMRFFMIEFACFRTILIISYLYQWSIRKYKLMVDEIIVYCLWLIMTRMAGYELQLSVVR